MRLKWPIRHLTAQILKGTVSDFRESLSLSLLLMMILLHWSGLEPTASVWEAEALTTRPKPLSRSVCH